jgi:hypothetical protein
MPQITNRQEWQKAIAKHFDAEYAAHVLPSKELLTKAEDFQRRTIGSTIYHWLKETGPELLQERELVKDPFGDADSEPVIVLISTVPGLVAASDMMPSRQKRVFYFKENAFQRFFEQHPDPKYLWHVTYTSYFVEELDAATRERAVTRYPLETPAEKFWLHREASILGELIGRGMDHLWKWDGERATMLEQGFHTWVA